MKKIILALSLFYSVLNAQATNYVMDFNGTGASVNLGNTVGNSLRSIEFWFKPNVTINSSTSLPAYTLIVRDDITQTHEYGIYIKGSDFSTNIGKLAFYVRYSGTAHEILSNSNSWIAGTWYHVAGVIDPTAGMLLYINGVLQTNTDATATAATDIDNSSPTVLGTWPTVTRYYNGRMDELRIWSRVISQSEIQAKMCQSLVPSGETGLKGYWQFNEGSGSQVLDATANAYNGTISSTTWLVDNACAVGGNYVMDFNGTGASVNLGNTVGNSLRSIEFWFKPNVTINSSTSFSAYTFIVRDDITQTHEYGVYIKGSDYSTNIGNLSFYVRYSGTAHEILSNSNSWVAGTWYHVAGVIDPTAGMLLYINGVLQTNTDATATAATDIDNSSPTVLGTWPTVTRYYNGRMDELRIWSRVISQSEIQSKMCQSLVPSGETGLKGYWQFNEGSGSQVLDATANAYNGTVSGATWINEVYCVSGIETNSALENSVLIYPNPGSGIINIKIENNHKDVTYVVYNNLGQEMKTGKLKSVESSVEINQLNAGIYFISIKMDTQTIIKKIIIEK